MSKRGKLIYHLTEINNLTTILQTGLLSRQAMINRKMRFIDVANHEIIQFREEHGLNNYVPFHWFVKNPFDGQVQKDHPEKRFAYICVKRELARTNGYKVLPMHPMMLDPFVIYDYDEGFDLIEWNIIDDRSNRDYRNTHIKGVCMAECIASEQVMPQYFQSIAVKTLEDKQEVERIKLQVNGNFFVDCNPQYFV